MALVAVPFFMIVMYGVLMKICRGTTDVFVGIMPCIGDDEYVSQGVKHSRRALQAIGARF